MHLKAVSEMPQITVVVPTYNQGLYINDALASIFNQNIPLEVFVLDGGSTDNTLDVIHAWKHKLAGWRSHEDSGQTASINEGISLGSAPFVCWLNSDDWYLPEGLSKLLSVLEANPNSPAAYGNAWDYVQKNASKKLVRIESFDENRLALRCIISQPATLIRRSAWEELGGLDESLNMAMDYDLWWRLYKFKGPLLYVDDFVAVNRVHDSTKTSNFRFQHYKEAMNVVRKYYGRIPVKWWLMQPYAVWFKTIKRYF